MILTASSPLPSAGAAAASAQAAFRARQDLRADFLQAAQVVHVGLELGHQHGRLARVHLQARDRAPLRAGQAPLVLEEPHQRLGQLGVEPVERRAGASGGAVRRQLRMHAVHHEAHERHPPSRRRRWKYRASSRVDAGGAGHQHEARRPRRRSSSWTRAARSLKPSYMPSKARKNSERSCRNCRPSDAVGELQGDGAGPRGHLQRQAAGHEVGLQEPAQHAGVEEAQQAVGRLQEVERVARGRRVQDHEVEALVRRQLEQLLHGHVLVAAGQRGRDLLVEAVLQDAPPRGLVRARSARPARRRCAWCRASWRTARLRPPAPPAAGPARAGRSPRCVEAQAGGQPARGVDRADEHAPAAQRALQAQRGGGRGLAHAARAADHQDALARQGARPARPPRGRVSRRLEPGGQAPQRFGADGSSKR